MRTAIAEKCNTVSDFKNSGKQKVLLFMLHVAVLVAFTAFVMWTPVQNMIVTTIPGFNLVSITTAMTVYILIVSPWKSVQQYTWTTVVQPTAHVLGYVLTEKQTPAKKKFIKPASNNITITIEDSFDDTSFVDQLIENEKINIMID